jgi:hypothetical protein
MCHHPSILLFPPHVSREFDTLETMFTLGIVAQVDDIDRDIFDGVLMLTFISDVTIDRPCTSGSRDIDASESSGGPS